MNSVAPLSLVALSLALCSCSVPEARTVDRGAHRTAAAIELAVIKDPELVEISGIAASRRNPGIVWAHNDSGDKPRLFAIDANGAVVTRLKLEGAQAVDWEDVAIGPGPDGRSTFFIGDIGDNYKVRPEITVYRALEPLVTPGDDMTAQADSLDFTLPGGPRNAETLLRDPLSDRLYIVAQQDVGPSPIFSANALAPAGTKVEMEQVGVVKLAAVFAGDISLDGTRVALRTPSVVAEWVRDRNESIEEALQKPPARVLPIAEPEGEAMAYSMDASIFLTREGPKHRFSESKRSS